MKQFISLGILLVVLSSCGTETVVVEEAIEVPTQVVEQTVSDIDTELANIASGDADIATDAEVTVDSEEIVVANDEGTVTISKDGTEVTGNAVITSDLRSEEEGDELEEAEEIAVESEVVEVQAKYNNSKQDVVLDIEYSLDSEGKISSIEVADTNGYNLTRNLSDGALDVLVGKSLDEVDDTYVAGGTWTVPAIKAALASE